MQSLEQMVTGRVDSVTMSAVKSLDASAKYFGLVGGGVLVPKRLRLPIS